MHNAQRRSGYDRLQPLNLDSLSYPTGGPISEIIPRCQSSHEHIELGSASLWVEFSISAS